MKLTNIIKTAVVSTFTLVALLAPLKVAAIPAGSVPYADEETSGATEPAFNIFNGVPSVGNEADFIRIKKDGEANSQLRNNISESCDNGDRFDVWFYVHNGAKPSLNGGGSGVGVADNTNAKVTFPTDKRTTFAITGTVTSPDVATSISNGATITCTNGEFRMKYVATSAEAYLDLTNTMIDLPASFVNGAGAAIGTNGLDGKMWGCWEQRVWMGLKVQLEKVETPTTPEEPEEEPEKPVKEVAEPEELPNTGTGSVLGIFAATTIAAAVAHRYFTARKYDV